MPPSEPQRGLGKGAGWGGVDHSVTPYDHVVPRRSRTAAALPISRLRRLPGS
jgi:hypothetical protein